MRHFLLFASLAGVLLAGCSSAPPADTEAKKPDASAPKADDDSNKVFTYAIPSLEKDSKVRTDTFHDDTPKVYVNFGFGGKVGSKVKSVWICDKSSNPKVPANTTIDDASIDVVPPQNAGNFSLSRPTAGWPKGDYHVDLYSDGKLVEAVKFKVD